MQGSVIVNDYYGMKVLFFGSTAICPLTQVLLKIMGRRKSFGSENSL